MPEQKLPVQVAEINGIEIDDVDLAEAGEDQIFEQFAANAAGSHH